MHTSAWQSIAATKLRYAVLDPRPRRRLAALIADAIVLDALGYHIRYVQGYLNIVQVEAERAACRAVLLDD